MKMGNSFRCSRRRGRHWCRLRETEMSSNALNAKALDEVEQLWIHCGIDLMQMKEFLENLDIFRLEDEAPSSDGSAENNERIAPLTIDNLQKFIISLPPQIKYPLLDCLSRQKIGFHVSREESMAISWYDKYIESLLGWHYALRRQLADQDTGSVKTGSSGQSHVRPLRKHHNNAQKTILISSVTTAAVTFLCSSLMIYCFLKCWRNNQEGDGRPLLTLGSSQKPSALGNSKNGVMFENTNMASPTGHCPLLDIDNICIESNGVPGISSPGPVVADETYASTSANIEGSLPPPPQLKTSPGKATPPPPPPSATAALPPGPPRPPAPAGPRPPPPPKPGTAPCPPGKLGRPPPLAPDGRKDGSQKTKLKPFFWDKVLANPDHSMVWHEINAGSFQFNEEMIENLFGASTNKNETDQRKHAAFGDSINYIRIIDPKKAQNISILLKALNLTKEEVFDALEEGNELPVEFLQTFVKMAPTQDEELKLRVYNGDLSQLGPADRFLKALVEIPFAFKRMDALLYMGSLQEEVHGIRDSFATIELACKELKGSRLFLKLLEAVLKTGNRMNDGTYRGGAQAFKLDTLLKLADVKGVDGKTTFLHFVIREIIRCEGLRAIRTKRENSSSSLAFEDLNDDDDSEDKEHHYCALGLEVVSHLPDELENVKKAAAFDSDAITGLVEKLGQWLLKTKNFLNMELSDVVDEKNGFQQTLKLFVENAESEVNWLIEEEKRIRSLVKSTIDYFHGNAGKDEGGMHLFVVVRNFLGMLEKECIAVKKEVESAKKAVKPATVKESPMVPPVASNPTKQLFAS